MGGPRWRGRIVKARRKLQRPERLDGGRLLHAALAGDAMAKANKKTPTERQPVRVRPSNKPGAERPDRAPLQAVHGAAHHAEANCVPAVLLHVGMARRRDPRRE